MNLHPQAQRELMISLKKTLKDKSSSMQIMITTHSSAIVDHLEHLYIVICKRSLDVIRGFKISSGQLPIDYWQKHELDQIRSNLFFQYKNSDFFFARHVIICEGKDDSEVVKLIAEKDKIDLESLGVTILNSEGMDCGRLIGIEELRV